MSEETVDGAHLGRSSWRRRVMGGRSVRWHVRRMWYRMGKRAGQLVSPMPAVGVEILVVFLLVVAPAIVSSGRIFFGPPQPDGNTAYSLYYLLTYMVPQLIMMVFIAVRAGVPLQRLGIVRPNAGLDVIGGAAALGVVFAVQWLRRHLLAAALPGFYHFLVQESLLHIVGRRAVPDSTGSWLIAGIYCFCVGMREEFIYRGYLLRRLQDWMGNRWLPLLISSVSFALIHSYQGYYGVISTFLFGPTMGLIMLGTRRLYIVALAHGAWDFLIITGLM